MQPKRYLLPISSSKMVTHPPPFNSLITMPGLKISVPPNEIMFYCIKPLPEMEFLNGIFNQGFWA
jgi:hypothetical protein